MHGGVRLLSIYVHQCSLWRSAIDLAVYANEQLHTKWELCFSMSVELGQLSLGSTGIINCKGTETQQNFTCIVMGKKLKSCFPLLWMEQLLVLDVFILIAVTNIRGKELPSFFTCKIYNSLAKTT